MPRPCGSTTSPSPAPEASKFPCRQGKIQFRTNQYRKTLINQIIIELTDTLLAAEFAPLTETEQGNCAHCRLAAAQAAAVASAPPTFQHLPILEQIISVDLDANMAKAPACGATTVTPEARLLFRRSGIFRAKAGKDEQRRDRHRRPVRSRSPPAQGAASLRVLWSPPCASRSSPATRREWPRWCSHIHRSRRHLALT